MMNLAVVNSIYTPLAIKVKPKKKKVARVSRESMVAMGERVAKGVNDTIKKHGPINAVDIAKKTKYSASGVRSCIKRINKDGLFTETQEKGGPRRKDVTFYALAENKDV